MYQHSGRTKRSAHAASHGKIGIGTAKQLARTTSGKGHLPRFDKILPSAMAKLVAEGLFEPWEGTYRITDKGRRLLSKLEFIEGLK